jgi:ferredoxin-nitrite reductase
LEGNLGFTVMVGGFFSAQRNELAIPLGIWLRPDQLAGFTLALLLHFERKGNRSARNRSRLMYLIEELGLDGYREQLLASYGEAVVAHDGSHLVDRVPRSCLGVHGQAQPGLHWVGLHVPMGRLDGESMLALAQLARTYGQGELRLTEAQNLLITDVPTGLLPALLAEPLLQRFRPDPGPLQAEAVSCTGSRYCSFALIPTKTTAQAAIDELERRLELPKPLRSHWTGCSNACGQPYMGEIGLMGAKARHNGEMVEAAKIFLGGSLGVDPQLAQLHEKAVPLVELVGVLEQLLLDRFGARRRPQPVQGSVQ